MHEMMDKRRKIEGVDRCWTATCMKVTTVKTFRFLDTVPKRTRTKKMKLIKATASIDIMLVKGVKQANYESRMKALREGIEELSLA